jgi:two-component system cell cycle sensor histidine kinase PleC
MLSAITTRRSHQNTKTLDGLGFRDKLGELAAAFDRLAETLTEREGLSQDNNASFKDPAQWLPGLAQFNRALRSCPDIASIERALVAAVEQAFPGCAAELCLSAERIGRGRRESSFKPTAESVNKQGRQCYATIPLLARGEAAGALSIYGHRGARLTSLEIELINVLTDQAALAIEKLHWFESSSARPTESRHTAEAFVSSRKANSDVASIVSHEFRVPLNLIMGYTEMMQEELMGKITPEQRKCLERVMKASEDLLALVTNMGPAPYSP